MRERSDGDATGLTVEEQRVVRLCALDEPVHRVEDVRPGGTRARVRGVVREQDDVLGLVTVPAQELHDVSRVVDAAVQLVRLAFVIYADLRFLSC